MTEGVSPIAVDEHRARLARAQKLLAEAGLDAMVVGPGSSLAYFTGADWGLSERFLGTVLGRTGEPVWVTPAFEKDRALEQIRVGTDVRAWQEDESSYALVARALADRGAATGRVGIEETMPFAFSDGTGEALPAARLARAISVTAGCRMVKDAHELALMRRACAITLTAYRAVFASLSEGLSVAQVIAWAAVATPPARRTRLRLLRSRRGLPPRHGGAAHAEGGRRRARGRGCRVHGYLVTSRAPPVFGSLPTDRQRRVWDLVRKAQAAAFDAARPGVECQAIDAAARKVIEDGGFSRGYAFLTHRRGRRHRPRRSRVAVHGAWQPQSASRRDDLHRRAGDLHPRRDGHSPRGHRGRHRGRVREPVPARGSGTSEEPAVV